MTLFSVRCFGREVRRRFKIVAWMFVYTKYPKIRRANHAENKYYVKKKWEERKEKGITVLSILCPRWPYILTIWQFDGQHTIVLRAVVHHLAIIFIEHCLKFVAFALFSVASFQFNEQVIALLELARRIHKHSKRFLHRFLQFFTTKSVVWVYRNFWVRKRAF